MCRAPNNIGLSLVVLVPAKKNPFVGVMASKANLVVLMHCNSCGNPFPAGSTCECSSIQRLASRVGELERRLLSLEMLYKSKAVAEEQQAKEEPVKEEKEVKVRASTKSKK